MRILFRRLPVMTAILLALAILAMSPGHSWAEAGNASGVLDGKTFFGKMGQNPNEKYDDKLSFDKGRFWSEICLRCGFQPGEYWTRVIDGAVHFRGQMNGGFGTFHYQGKIIDGKAESVVFWRKDRWYWTSSRQLEFEGAEQPPEMSYPISQAIKIAKDALTGTLPDYCW